MKNSKDTSNSNKHIGVCKGILRGLLILEKKGVYLP